MNLSPLLRPAAALLVAASAAIAQPITAQSTIIREGEGPRRAQLDAMELKPFPKGAWDKLSEWTNGDAPTTGSLDNKVVLVLCWADWYPPSARAMNMAKKLADKYAKDGLVVIAAHDSEGWKDAKKPKAEAEGAMLLEAVDAKREFRQALLEDQDPDFYLIDRAGQLRFADVATESVEPAVEQLVKETKEAAGGINADLASKSREADATRRRSAAIRESVSMIDLPEVPFSMPRPEAYKDSGWPALPKDPNNSQPVDPKNPPPPIVVAVPETGYLPKKPMVKGRVVLLYFWHPDLNLSFDLIPKLDQLQRQYGRDLTVIGVMTPMNVGSKEYKIDAEPDKIKKKVEAIVASGRPQHSLLLDTDGIVIKNVNKEQTLILPFGAIISSDNVARYWGFMGKSEFWGALDKVLRVDPGVQARRAAEEEYLRTHPK